MSINRPLNFSRIACFSILLLFLSGTSQAAHHAEAMLIKLQKAEHRDASNIERDPYRHPIETLSFFQVEPHMTVVEISPGGKGWYMEWLAPLLRDQGTYYAASYDQSANSDYVRRNLKMFNAKLAAHPQVYDRVIVTEFASPHKLEIAPAGSADRVLTFRNVHNWVESGSADVAFSAFFKALKPGGILGVVEHRADPNLPQDPKAESGYVREDLVIQMAERAGFKLLAKSEINANPKDTRDHPKGVWSLPPSLRADDPNYARYQAIGESDRMTLSFIKPTP